jgi:hypothetical protein
MQSHLGTYFRRTRIANGISLGDLAQQIGYRNLSKGCRRIATLETTGRARGDLIDRLAAALGIDGTTVEQLRQMDFRAWEEWADDPDQRRYVVLRLLPAIYSEIPVPANVTTREEAEAFASAVAAERRRDATRSPPKAGEGRSKRISHNRQITK